MGSENPEPEFQRFLGFLVSEWMTAGIVLLVLVALGTGFLVDRERDDLVKTAEKGLAQIKNQLDTAAQAGRLLVCDISLVPMEVQDSEYISFSIKILPTNQGNPEAGYGAAVVIESERERDGNDRFVIAKRLYASLNEDEEYRLMARRNDKDDVAFSVLFSERAVCKATNV